jgi:uncharacterized protein YciI
LYDGGMGNNSAFVYVLRASREGLAEGPTAEEEARLEQHFQYLRSRLEEAKLSLAGPCLDEALGVMVFRACTEEAARGSMEGDPSVRHGLMSAEWHPFRVSLVEGA